jgi:mRNA-degrading endonuclease RelE of RelBE toxin-antitoxin system
LSADGKRKQRGPHRNKVDQIVEMNFPPNVLTKGCEKLYFSAMDVIWQPKSLKQLRKIGDRSVQERILVATRELAKFPMCPNIKQLINHRYEYRLRVGNWRVFFNAHEEIHIINIEEVKKRDERTY